jgi:hypothetical protein
MIVFYFRQVPLISEGKIVEIVEVPDHCDYELWYILTCVAQVVCRCLDDEVVEVREKAATYASNFRALCVILRLKAPNLQHVVWHSSFVTPQEHLGAQGTARLQMQRF